MNVNINWPADKTIFFDEVVSVEGRVLPRVDRLTSDGMEVFLEKRAFRFSHPLALGKNALKFTAYDANGVQLEQDKIRLLRLERFTDVPAEHWAAVPISVLAMNNIITGYPGNIFKPEGNITRAELCTLLMKSKGQTASGARTKFKDVPASHWAAKYIAQAVSKGVVLGYPGGTFNPNGLISRAEGVAVIARFADLPAPTVLEVPFTDIPGRHWAYKEITSAKQAGLLGFLDDKPFEPGKKLTRAEVADILSKTVVIAPKIDEMLDFERGY
jgi:hypothetical protein